MYNHNQGKRLYEIYVTDCLRAVAVYVTNGGEVERYKDMLDDMQPGKPKKSGAEVIAEMKQKMMKWKGGTKVELT